jgi:hypothetical protein
MTQLLVGICLIAIAAALGFYGTQVARDGWAKVFPPPATAVSRAATRDTDAAQATADQFLATIVPAISSPLPGSTLGPTTLVTGVSPLVFLDHYVLVTAVKTGVRYVVGDSFRPDSAGTFGASARFGSGEVGVSEEFSIQVMATNRPLAEGELRAMPPDAKVSRSVAITRIH